MVQSRADPTKTRVMICSGTGCNAYGARQLIEAFRHEVESLGLSVEIKPTGCHGFCEKGPIVIIQPQDICYVSVKPADVTRICSETLMRGEVVEDLLYWGVDGKAALRESDIPFYSHQMRLVLGDNLKIDPGEIDDYIALGGYSGLSKALSEMTAENVLDEVKKANLRGRGGGGFPAGAKWEATRKAPGEPKYVIVNADEGDPGAYMDRSILEGNPHSVLEGLIIGAYAIGASEGFVYVRHEYPLAVANCGIALKQAREYGFLGKDILGSGFDFDVKIHRGAGAFVSGESSALVAAIEGSVGEPRPKYVRTATSGLFGKPTCINNVETWANVPLIIRKGQEWYRSIGTGNSKGTKVFSLVGKVNNTGLVEVPMGTPLREIIFSIGGGMRGGKAFKAVQTGGPSGGCLPEALLDVPVDFDRLTDLGSMMGSGGMIAMDEDTCMVDVALYFVRFLADESCGKCVPCREGLHQMVNILERIASGRGREGDIELLEEIGDLLQDVSLCALGKTAPNPVLSTIRYFREEYEEHVKHKKCRARVCKGLISYFVNPERCGGCTICLQKCPNGAILGGKGLVHIIDSSKCDRCGICIESCPKVFSAIEKVAGLKTPEPVSLGTKVYAKKKASKTVQA